MSSSHLEADEVGDMTNSPAARRSSSIRKKFPPFSGVMATTNDSCISKLSAVTQGYYKDNALPFFVTQQPADRRPPLINRGYYSRVIAIRSIVCDFLEGLDIARVSTPFQIVNIGAGLDPFYYWLMEELESDSYSNLSGKNLRYFEIDFPQVLQLKTAIIEQHVVLQNAMRHYETPPQNPIVDDQGIINAQTWKMIAGDLRNIEALDKRAQELGLSREVPTLFLVECVLAYLSPEHADALIKWAAEYVDAAPTCFVNYDPFQPNDRFGKMMCENLRARNCPLLSVHAYPTIPDLIQRFEKLGYDDVNILDMDAIYRECLDRVDILRIEHLELFDELEEWRLIQSHYYLAVCLRMARRTNSFGVLSSLVGYWSNAVSEDAPMPRFTTLECLRATHFQILSEAASRLMAQRSDSLTSKRGGFSRSTFCSLAETNWVLLSPVATSTDGGRLKRSDKQKSTLTVKEGILSTSLKDSASAPTLRLKENQAPFQISTADLESDTGAYSLKAKATVADVLRHQENSSHSAHGNS